MYWILALRLINIFGHWPGGGLKGRLQFLISCSVTFHTILLFIAESYSTHCYFKTNIRDALINLNEMLSALQCFATTLAFILYRGKLKDVLNQVDDLTERILAEVGQPAIDEISKRRKVARIAHLLFFWSFVAIFHWALRPLLHLAIYGEKLPIVHSWVPFEYETLPGFFGNFFLQLIPCTSFCLGICMFLSVFVGVCEHILGHFAILNYRLENIKYGKANTISELKRCVIHHDDILKLCRTFHEFTAVPLVMFCCMTVLVLCVILYELTMVQGASTERVVNVLEEGYQELLFLATYCWYVNEITLQCGRMLRPGYMADWYNGTQREKKFLLNIMTRSMVPQEFGIFIRVDILTFLNVLKGAFSYYNFLGAVSVSKMSDVEL